MIVVFGARGQRGSHAPTSRARCAHARWCITQRSQDARRPQRRDRPRRPSAARNAGGRSQGRRKSVLRRHRSSAPTVREGLHRSAAHRRAPHRPSLRQFLGRPGGACAARSLARAGRAVARALRHRLYAPAAELLHAESAVLRDDRHTGAANGRGASTW
jgi:hypothetical protein